MLLEVFIYFILLWTIVFESILNRLAVKLTTPVFFVEKEPVKFYLLTTTFQTFQIVYLVVKR